MKLFDWFRYRFIDRYHIVKTNLKPGYYDVDKRMLHSMFSLLCDYIEIEKPRKIDIREEWNSWLKEEETLRLKKMYIRQMKYQNEKYFEAMSLYLWWKNWVNEDVYSIVEEDEAQEMSERLIKIRRSLWT